MYEYTYNDYKAVMEDQQLEESGLVKVFLNEAAKCQRYIKTLKKHEAPQAVIDVQIREKSNWIWQAITTAETEKKQGWRFMEDGPKVETMLKQQLEDIKEAKKLKGMIV